MAILAVDEFVNAVTLMQRARVCVAHQVTVAARLGPLGASTLMGLELSASCEACTVKARDLRLWAFGIAMV